MRMVFEKKKKTKNEDFLKFMLEAKKIKKRFCMSGTSIYAVAARKRTPATNDAQPTDKNIINFTSTTGIQKLNNNK